MRQRGLWVAVVLAVGLMVAWTVPRGQGPAEGRLMVLAAASLRPVVEDIEQNYPGGFEIRWGGSEELVAQIRLTENIVPTDIFLPADASYLMKLAPHDTLSPPITTMQAVALAREPIRDLAHLRTKTLALAEPNTAAIGLLTKAHLETLGEWAELQPRIIAHTDTVSSSANAVQLESVEAAIVWDATARLHPTLVTSPLPELAGIRAEVRGAVLSGSRRKRAAQDLLAFLTSPEGRAIFRKHGFPEPTP
ncbi:MAG: molybdate ABC transporter substrate-binding protein [Fimbriiglobus sp.]